MNHRKIDHLLNTELSAVEAYEQVLQEKEWKVLSRDPQIQALFHILVDHIQAASQLGTEVQRLDGRPVNGTQAWCSRSHRRMDAARLFGDIDQFRDKAALEALKEGEESGLKEYQAVLHHRALSPEVKPLIRSLKTKQQAHVRALDDLLLRLIRARSGHRPLGVARIRRTRSGAAPRAIRRRSKQGRHDRSVEGARDSSPTTGALSAHEAHVPPKVVFRGPTVLGPRGACLTPGGRGPQDACMRIPSLIASSTEIVYALGFGDDLVGRANTAAP